MASVAFTEWEGRGLKPAGWKGYKCCHVLLRSCSCEGPEKKGLHSPKGDIQGPWVLTFLQALVQTLQTATEPHTQDPSFQTV